MRTLARRRTFAVTVVLTLALAFSARWRAPAFLAGLLALVTLVLTMGGLYAVLTMAVGQRTRELAIRVALGANEVSLRWMVLAQGLRLVAVGALVGLGVAVPLTRLLEGQLYGIAPHDVATLAAGLVGLAGGRYARQRLAGPAGHASRHRSRAAERVSRSQDGAQPFRTRRRPRGAV